MVRRRRPAEDSESICKRSCAGTSHTVLRDGRFDIFIGFRFDAPTLLPLLRQPDAADSCADCHNNKGAGDGQQSKPTVEINRTGDHLFSGKKNQADYTAEMRGWIPVAVLQLQYNLLDRAADREHLPLAIARGMGLMAWSPLAGGLLTGKTKFREKQAARNRAKEW